VKNANKAKSENSKILLDIPQEILFFSAFELKICG
jgi:hypothetical protein